MKAKLIRCHICHNWYSPSAREHCNGCGAVRIYVPEVRAIRHFNCQTFREMRSGFVHYRFKANALLIAQILQEGKMERSSRL